MEKQNQWWGGAGMEWNKWLGLTASLLAGRVAWKQNYEYVVWLSVIFASHQLTFLEVGYI